MLVVAALILGACVVASSLLIQSSIDGASSEIASLRTTVAGMQAVAAQAAAPAAAAAPARVERPDPNQRYSVDTQGSPAKGPASAQVTVVEFSDFQCPFCARVTSTMKEIENAYGDRVRIVFKHLPLRIHSSAPLAHAAAAAAHRQGKFWPMYEAIFANQRDLSEAAFLRYAGEIGLDVDRFKKDMASAEVKAKVDADAKEAASLGVTGTPGFFVNGRFLSGARPFDSFKTMIDEELAKG